MCKSFKITKVGPSLKFWSQCMTSFFDFESLISFEEKIALHFFKKRESANYQCGQAISRFAIPTMQCTKFFIPLQYICFIYRYALFWSPPTS